VPSKTINALNRKIDFFIMMINLNQLVFLKLM
jgi:hypothetical protein